MAKGRRGFIAAVVWLLAAIDAQAAPTEPKAITIYGDLANPSQQPVELLT